MAAGCRPAATERSAFGPERRISPDSGNLDADFKPGSRLDAYSPHRERRAVPVLHGLVAREFVGVTRSRTSRLRSAGARLRGVGPGRCHSKMLRPPLPLLLLGVVACSPASAPPEEIGQAVLYGRDDRVEVYEAAPNLEALATRSVLAVIPAERLRVAQDGVAPPENNLGDVDQLCASEPFREQPVAANCSATLVDADLVLTAGHCFSDEAECRSSRFVFDYLYHAPRQLGPLLASSVYSCRRMVQRSFGAGQSDFAFVQLDRPVSSDRTPASIASSRRVQPGQLLNALGFGSGIPLKVDSHALVLEAPLGQDDFTLAVDAFAGASGMGIFDSDAELVGFLVRGEGDFSLQGNCYVAQRHDDVCSDCQNGGEQSAYAAAVIEQLCTSGWQSERLCGAPPAVEASVVGADAGCGVARGAARVQATAVLLLALGMLSGVRWRRCEPRRRR